MKKLFAFILCFTITTQTFSNLSGIQNQVDLRKIIGLVKIIAGVYTCMYCGVKVGVDYAMHKHWPNRNSKKELLYGLFLAACGLISGGYTIEGGLQDLTQDLT